MAPPSPSTSIEAVLNGESGLLPSSECRDVFIDGHYYAYIAIWGNDRNTIHHLNPTSRRTELC